VAIAAVIDNILPFTCLVNKLTQSGGGELADVLPSCSLLLRRCLLHPSLEPGKLKKIVYVVCFI
jgi:hypothetical protein